MGRRRRRAGGAGEEQGGKGESTETNCFSTLHHDSSLDVEGREEG